MLIRTKLAVLSLSVVLGVSAVASAQEKKPEGGAMAMPQEHMDAMMKAMTPGEPHKHLAKMAGDWTYTSKVWMAPGQAPVESAGTMRGETILGGRYVQTSWKGDFMGQPFEGRGTEAWDNVGKQYVSTWMDNMGTGILHTVGSCENGFKTCKVSGDMFDPTTGQKATIRFVVSWMDDNHFMNTMYGKDPASGQEMKMMELDVTRKK